MTDEADGADLSALATLAGSPDVAVPVSAVVVVAYLDGDGEDRLTLATFGESTLTNRLGLLAWAEHAMTRADEVD